MKNALVTRYACRSVDVDVMLRLGLILTSVIEALAENPCLLERILTDSTFITDVAPVFLVEHQAQDIFVGP